VTGLQGHNVPLHTSEFEKSVGFYQIMHLLHKFLFVVLLT